MMFTKKRLLMGLVGLSLMGAGVVQAEEAEQGGSFWDKTKVTGQFNTSYNYNFNNPPQGVAVPGANAIRGFDARHNDFDFNLAEIAIENAPNDWAKFRLDLNFGEDVAAVDALKGGFIAAGADEFGIQQVYADLTAPVGNGLSFKIGHFVTQLGYEVIESSANFNTSRSILFNWAIPFTHTGVLMSYSFNDKFSTSLGVVNGWDVAIDNNKGKTLLGQLVYKPIETLTLSLQGTYGPELANSEGNFMGILDFVGIWTPVENFTLGLNYDWAKAEGVGCGGMTCWQGAAVYAHYKPWERVGFTVRGEYFDDDGSRLGIAGQAGVGATDIDVGEGTGTLHIYLADGWETRLELRHDQADRAIFTKANGTTRKFQDTVSAEVVYAF